MSSWVFTAPQTPEPPHPQEQTELGEPPGPGPSWSLPHRSCKGGLPLVPTEAASSSPPRPTLGTGLCAEEAAGEGQAAACQPVAAAWSEPVRQLISTSHPLDHFLLFWSFSSWSST